MISHYDVKTAQERAQERYAPIIRQHQLERELGQQSVPSWWQRMKQWMLRRGSWQRNDNISPVEPQMQCC